MPKLSNKQFSEAALSYAIEYAIELGYDSVKVEDQGKFIDDLSNTSTIQELLEKVEPKLENGTKVKGFYTAMKKVIPHMDREEDDVSCNGTEDRGWYRVWEAVVHESYYFSAFDLGRDAGILLALYEAKAITKDQYEAHRVRNTLNMAKEDRWMSNGRPDVAKMVGHFRPEWLEKCVDLQLLYGFKMAEHASASTAALLTLIKE